MLRLVILCTLLWSGLAWSGRAQLEFHSEATVAPGIIRLGDLAEIQGDSNLVKRLQNLEVGRLEMPGRESRLSIQVIKTFHLKRVAPIESLTVVGEGGILVRARAALLTSDSILSLLEERLQEYKLGVKGLDWDLEAPKIPKEIRIPEDSCRIDIEIPPRFDGRGSEVANLRISRGTGKAQQHTLSFTIRRWGMVVRSTTTIPRGQPILASQVALERVELTHQPRLLANELDKVIGRTPTRTISRHVDIAENWLEKPFAIHEGDQVTLKTQIGSALITTQGRALRSAYIGQRVEVENATTRKKLQGTVDAIGSVLLRP